MSHRSRQIAIAFDQPVFVPLDWSWQSSAEWSAMAEQSKSLAPLGGSCSLDCLGGHRLSLHLFLRYTSDQWSLPLHTCPCPFVRIVARISLFHWQNRLARKIARRLASLRVAAESVFFAPLCVGRAGCCSFSYSSVAIRVTHSESLSQASADCAWIR